MILYYIPSQMSYFTILTLTAYVWCVTTLSTWAAHVPHTGKPTNNENILTTPLL